MKARNWYRRIVLAQLIVLALAVVFSPLWFPRLGSFLVVADPITGKADVIAMLGGGDAQRPVVAANLFKEKFADRVVTTGELIPDYIEAMGNKLTFAELGAKLISIEGVPPRDITPINKGTSTFEEAQALKDYIVEKKYTSMIVVTSIYHTRRARLVFKKTFKGSGINVIVRPADGGNYSLDQWWSREEDLAFVNNEYIKLMLYLLKGRI